MQVGQVQNTSILIIENNFQHLAKDVSAHAKIEFLQPNLHQAPVEQQQVSFTKQIYQTTCESLSLKVEVLLPVQGDLEVYNCVW